MYFGICENILTFAESLILQLSNFDFMNKEVDLTGGYPAIATDCVVFGFDGRRLNILLLEMEGEIFRGKWAFPGGLMQANETVEDCAARVLEERTGIKGARMEEFGTYSDVKRDPRGRIISISFFVLTQMTDLVCGKDVKQAKWFRVDQMPELALDYEEVFKGAQKGLREKMVFEPLAFDLLEEHFSMTKLQKLYEAILEVKFDRRNFYRKILTLGILERTDGKKSTWLGKATGNLQVRKRLPILHFKKAEPLHAYLICTDSTERNTAL